MELPSDVLLQIYSLMNNETLRKVSATRLWDTVRELVHLDEFWKLRVEALLETNNVSSCGIAPEDWKKIYHFLSGQATCKLYEFSIRGYHCLARLCYSATLIRLPDHTSITFLSERYSLPSESDCSLIRKLTSEGREHLSRSSVVELQVVISRNSLVLDLLDLAKIAIEIQFD